jgi:hypothetical protein
MAMNAAAPFPWFTDAEIVDLCDGLVLPGAQARYLRRMGLEVARKPSGKVLLMRSELERVRGAARFTPPAADPAQNQPAPGLNVVGLHAWAQGRKKKPHGQKTQGR